MPFEEYQRVAVEKEPSELTMEALLRDGAIYEAIFSKVEENPVITIDDLRAHAHDQGIEYSDPKRLELFFDEIQRWRKRVADAKAVLERDAAAQNLSEADMLFGWVRSVANKDPILNPELRGRADITLELGMTIALYLSSIFDYHQLGDTKQEESDAFIDTDQPVGLYLEESEGEQVERQTFPLMVFGTTREWAKQSRIHEVGHLKHKPFRAAFRGNETLADMSDTTWGKTELTPEEKAYLQTEHSDEELQSSPAFRSAVHAFLGLAKEELLAEYESQINKDLHRYRIQSIELEDGPYNYFKKEFGISQDSRVYQLLRRETFEILRKQCDVAQKIINQYTALQLEGKNELFKWVLARIPIQDWEDKLTELGFVAEGEALTELHNEMRRIIPDATIDIQSRSTRALRAADPKQSLMRIVTPFIQEAKTKPSRLM